MKRGGKVRLEAAAQMEKERHDRFASASARLVSVLAILVPSQNS